MDLYDVRTSGPTLMIRFYRKPSGVVREMLRYYGYKYYYTIKMWCGQKGQDQIMGAVERWNERSKAANRKICGRTLCWTCAKSGYGCVSECCWEREFKPYPGWEAIRQDIKLYETDKKEYTTESYLVLECPGFKEEKRCRNG
ncbi:MAG: hypothetical protein J6S60_02885 [Oscillospiraceae bacterium]|nr:hypothetical protein [Oscillospiraceae bacterium]